MSGTILNFNGKDAAVLGVGINVAQDLRDNATATSLDTLRMQTEGSLPPIRREAVLAAFCGALESLMDSSIEETLKAYREHDMLRGRIIRVHHRTREEDDPRDYVRQPLSIPRPLASHRGLLAGLHLSLIHI